MRLGRLLIVVIVSGLSAGGCASTWVPKGGSPEEQTFVTRSYPVPADQVYRSAQQLYMDRGMQITASDAAGGVLVGVAEHHGLVTTRQEFAFTVRSDSTGSKAILSVTAVGSHERFVVRAKEPYVEFWGALEAVMAQN